jgi:hypothetical protein
MDARGIRVQADGIRVGDEVDLMPARGEFHAELGGDDAAAADGGVTDDPDVHGVLNSEVRVNGELFYNGGSLKRTVNRSVLVAGGDFEISLKMLDVIEIAPVGASFWTKLDGWANDDHAAAFAAFLTSCRALNGERGPGRETAITEELKNVCRRAFAAIPLEEDGARKFFEDNFRPLRISKLGDSDGFLTGYYEPIIEGSRVPTGEFTAPLFRRPPNLVASGRRKLGDLFPNKGVKVGRRFGRRNRRQVRERRRLPGPSGLDLQQRLATAENPLPIVFLTGHGDIPKTVRAMKAGAVDFLTKPVDAPVLIDAVARAIARDSENRVVRARQEEARGTTGSTAFETDVRLTSGDARRASLNGERLPSAARLRHDLRTLVFTPDRLAVVKGAPSTRRAYLDRSLGRLLPSKAALPTEYAAAVGQRNAGLRRLRAQRGRRSRRARDQADAVPHERRLTGGAGAGAGA